MKIEPCLEKSSDKIIVVKQNGRKFSVLNNSGLEVWKIEFDGCVAKNRLAADWVISGTTPVDMIIELKGRGVEHGIKQVMATAREWQKAQLLQDNSSKKILGFIVATQWPSFDTIVQKGVAAFAREFGSKLKVYSREGHIDLADFRVTKDKKTKPKRRTRNTHHKAGKRSPVSLRTSRRRPV